MDSLPSRIPDELVPEVFALAAQLYAQQGRGYTLDELMVVGAEARIPPEFIQQAIAQCGASRIAQIQAKRQQKETFRQRFWTWGIGTGAIVVLLGGVLMVLISRPSEPTFKAPVMTNPLQDATTTPLDWSNAKLQRTNLIGRNLKGANFSYADLSYVKLQEVNLENANLRGANLREANLENANLAGANLQDVNLRNANLKNANLAGANLNGADLSQANLEGAILPHERP